MCVYVTEVYVSRQCFILTSFYVLDYVLFVCFDDSLSFCTIQHRTRGVILIFWLEGLRKTAKKLVQHQNRTPSITSRSICSLHVWCIHKISLCLYQLQATSISNFRRCELTYCQKGDEPLSNNRPSTDFCMSVYAYAISNL